MRGVERLRRVFLFDDATDGLRKLFGTLRVCRVGAQRRFQLSTRTHATADQFQDVRLACWFAADRPGTLRPPPGFQCRAGLLRNSLLQFQVRSATALRIGFFRKFSRGYEIGYIGR
jgi:hypothetical protein